jgi:hypothetical protein
MLKVAKSTKKGATNRSGHRERQSDLTPRLFAVGCPALATPGKGAASMSG